MSNEPLSAAKVGLIRVIFPGRSGLTGEVALKWVPDKQLRSYFKDPVLRPYGLMALRSTCKLFDQSNRKLRLTYVPKAGDTIIMQKVGSAMS